jgi:hypothetical protein
MPASNDNLVRVEDFSKSMARVLFFSSSDDFPLARFSLRWDAQSSKLIISEYVKSANDNR